MLQIIMLMPWLSANSHSMFTQYENQKKKKIQIRNGCFMKKGAEGTAVTLIYMSMKST